MTLAQLTKNRDAFWPGGKSRSFYACYVGADLELLSRELNVTAARLSKWWEQFLTSGRATLQKRPQDGRDLEIARLQQKLREVTMNNELLQQKIERLENGLPLPPRRLRL